MPRLNGRGDAVMGVGGPIWGRGFGTAADVIYADGGTCGNWLDDDTIIAQVAEIGWLVAICSAYAPKQWQPYWDKGCNFLTAGGGLWQAHLVGVDCYGNYGHLPNMSLGLVDNDGRGYAGPGGEMNIIPGGGVGIQIHSRSHGVVPLPWAGPARDVQVLGPTAAIWRDDAGIIHAHGIPAPAQTSPGGSPHVVWLPNGEAWLVYWSSSFGLIAHAYHDASNGRLLAGPGVNAFYHDAKVLTAGPGAGKLVVAWSSGAGELPGELVVVPDVLSLPRANFGSPPVVSVPPITYPCWTGFFVGDPSSPPHWQTNDDPASVPGNSYLLIAGTTPVRRDTGEEVGTYCGGGGGLPGVDDIEQVAAVVANQGRIPFCYYDGAEWPRMPNLPPTAIVLHQLYQSAGEPAAGFQSRIAAQIQRFQHERPGMQNGFCAQCFTSNSSLTTDLVSVTVSVGQLAQQFRPPAVFGFSGTGRKTGLQDNPHVRPLWEQMFAQVPGTPDAPVTPPIGGSSMDWGKIDAYGRQRWAELDVQRKSQELADRGFECREFQQDMFVKITSELCHQQGVTDLELFWKAGVPEYGNPQDVKNKLQYIGEDIIVDRAARGYKDSVSAMGHPSAQWNAGGALAPVTGNDLSRCGPPPNLSLLEPPVEPPIEPPIEPTPGDPSVTIFDWTKDVHRGDLKGIVIHMEGMSRYPVTEFELGLNDGAPPIRLQLPPPYPPDGRYFRVLSFKPVRTGDWLLTVKVKNEQGHWGQSEGTYPVTVRG